MLRDLDILRPKVLIQRSRASSTKMKKRTVSQIILWVLFLLIKIAIAGCTSLSTQNSCSLENTQCDVSEMRHRLQNVVNLTNKVLETLKEGAVSSNCPIRPEDCEAVYRCGSRRSGVYTVWPWNRILKTSIQVYCDMETDGGGWTVIQRRGNFGRSVDYFYNDWNMYKQGFGELSQDFWIGNDLLFALTNQKLYTLGFVLRDLEGQSRWAMYDKFWVESEEYNYTLHVHGYTGNAGDSFSAHNGQKFTTKDRDNDNSPENCAERFKGAWWYNKCHLSNLNGFYLNGTHASFADGIEWQTWRGYNYSLPFTEMKIRPIFFKAHEDESHTKTPM